VIIFAIVLGLLELDGILQTWIFAFVVTVSENYANGEALLSPTPLCWN
jgi:hypothetical protein